MEQTHYEQGAEYPILGPHYFAARDVVDAFIDKFTSEQFEPLLKAFSEQLYVKAKDEFESYLLSDASVNIQGAIRQMVDDTVKALLGGEAWALERYPLSAYHDGERIRKAVASHIPVELQDKRIADLEAEVKGLKESLRYART